MTDRFSTYLFDLDGTLIDSLADLRTALNLVRSNYSLPDMEIEEVRQKVGDGARKLVERSLPESLFSDQAVQAFLSYYSEHLLEHTRPYPKIPALLARLQEQGARLGVVTNKPLAMTQPILKGLGLTGFFQVVLGGDSLPTKKPHPGMIEEAMRILQSSPQDTLVVGDHHTDLHAGDAAGTHTCFCEWGFGHSDGLSPDLTAATSQALCDLLAPAP